MQYNFKSIIGLFVVFHLVYIVRLQSQSQINFIQQDLASAIFEAEESNKLIFIDAYTTWCGPCKQMEKNIFTHDTIAQTFNENFINVKLDMEKGLGPQIAAQYNVIVYPSLLFIDKDKNLVHKAVGYHNVIQMLNLADAVENPSLTLQGMRKRYEDGERSPVFLEYYTKALADLQNGSHQVIAQEYMNTKLDWSEKENLIFLFRYTEVSEGPMFDYLINNKDKFVGIFGSEPYGRKVEYLVANSVQNHENPKHPKDIFMLYNKVYKPEKAKELAAYYDTNYYLKTEDYNKYVDAVKFYVKKYGTKDDAILNEMAWNFFIHIDFQKPLKKALKWSKKSVNLNPDYYNLDTLAALYFKLGKNEKAIETAVKAIVEAKKSNIDYSETTRMVDYIHSL